MDRNTSNRRESRSTQSLASPLDEGGLAPGAEAALESMIDHEFLEYCAREGDDRISMEEVLQAMSKIPGSMAQAIIEEERADRF